MNKKELLVSVIMPAYNAEKYIGEAIESILNQTFKDFEFIILDDCSTDKTWEIIQEYAVKDERIVAVKNEKNLKISATLNKGINLARGKYIARMDADDWSFPYRLEKQIDFMESNPEVVISGGSIDITNSKLEHINYRKYPLDDVGARKIIFRYSPFAHPVVMYRTEYVKIAGLYYQYFFLAQDYDLYFRIGMLGKFGNIPDLLLKLRTHKRSSSQSYLRKQEIITILIRFKAWIIYNYKLKFLDFIYTFAEIFGLFLIPPSIKFRLFSYLRSSKEVKD
jgi:glycosyltransferase involved in cell wall biosynthesis